MRAASNMFHVDEIFEIRLLPECWQKVQSTAFKHNLTYSWIVRLCLFRLCESELSRDKEMNLLNRKIRFKYLTNQKPLHRHQLCLFGTDGLHLRMLAASLGFTISQLVRIALEMYLDEIIIDLKNGLDVVSKGTKIFQRGVGIKKRVTKFHNKETILQAFPADWYWPFKPIIRFPWQVPG